MALTAEELVQLAELKVIDAAINKAILAIVGGAQSYSLDTSQTRQTVSKANLSELRILRAELKTEIEALEAKACGGGGAIRVTPAW